jgi:N-acyl homoserine lactone hydrolase
MAPTVSLPTKLYYIARMISAFVGPPVARWSARPALPSNTAPAAFELGNGVTLWQLPVGVVRVREWHRELPRELAEVDDDLRFPVMMSNKGITNWLDCTAWLIDHPERCILVDTGESIGFGTSAYFEGVPKTLAKGYPKIIDATAADGNDLTQALAVAGLTPADIDLCVLTHTHSDHIGNIDQLDHSTPLLVSPEELTPSSRGGRLLARLPQGDRVQTTTRTEPHEVFGSVMPLTERKDVFVISTPGHTVGHQSVVIDLGELQVIIAGDAAFDDQQVQSKAIPGIVENRQLTLQTYEVLLGAQQKKPTLNLFTHDPTNRDKLAEFSRPLQ